MAALLADWPLQDPSSGRLENANVSMTLAQAQVMAQEIKKLEAQTHVAETLLKNYKNRSGNARNQTRHELSLEPKHIEISSFLQAPPPSLAPPDPAPELEALPCLR